MTTASLGVTSASGAPPDLLERADELSEMVGLLDRAVAGRGGLLAFEGAAGIGKSRLLGAGIEAARERGMTVSRARGGSLEQEFAFGAARQLLEPLVAAVGPDQVFAGAAAAAAPVLGHGASSGHNDPGTVLHGLYWITVNVAETRSLALICDDAHWFDSPSLRFLAYLARRVDELPIAVIVGTRPPTTGPEAELLGRLLADPAGQHLRPAPLSDDGVAQIVRSTLPTPAEPSFCLAVAEASRGNPFLVGELVRAAARTGIAEGRAAGTTLAELSAGTAVLNRIGRLPEAALELARAVAVLGNSESEGAPLRHAAALAGLDIDTAGDAADALLRAEILGPERPLAFVHPLVRSAVYGDLLPGDRSRRHRRAAELLRAESASAEQVAKHVMWTEPAGDPDAVGVLRHAARSALKQGATDVAVTYLRRALEEPPTSRLPVLLELGAAEAFTIDEQAVDHLGEALPFVDDPGLRITLAAARSMTLADHGRPDEAIAGLEDLRAGLGDDPVMQQTLLAATIVVGLVGPDSAPLVAGHVTQLLASVGPDDEAPPIVLGVRALVGAFANEPASVVGALAARALATIPQDDSALSMWFHLPVTALVMCDRDGEAAAIVEEGLAIARRMGIPVFTGITLFLRSWIAFRTGELDDAEADAREAIEILSINGIHSITAGPIAILVEVLRERDQLDAAEALLAEFGHSDGDGHSWFHLFLISARTKVHSVLGRWDETESDARRGLERTTALGCDNPAFIPWHAYLVTSDVASQRLGATTRANAEMALQLAEEFGAPRARAEGLRAIRLTDPSAQEAGFEAARLFREVGSRIDEARTLVGILMVFGRQMPRDAAHEQLSRALDLAERSGSSRLVARIRGLSGELGLGVRSRPVSGVGSLTPSERRVAALAAAGRRNKDVAQELYVTVKTVETHLARVFTKLGITSRAELQAALTS
jgi:DNA-binding CsgD family transcriptional regulator